MIPVTLPHDPDREALLGFWASIALLGGMLPGVLAFATGLASIGLALGIFATASLCTWLVGVRRARMIDRAYGLWNRAARKYLGWALNVVTAIWYWTVITAVARIGGGDLGPDAPGWLERGTLAESGYGDAADGTSGRVSEGGVRDFTAWTIHSGRFWALVLVPLLVLLRALDPASRKSTAPNIYTLY